MWEAGGKTTVLLLSLGSLFPKTETNARCFLLQNHSEVLHRAKKESSILRTVKRRKANWIGHNLRRNCLLKHAVEGKVEGRIEVTGRRGRRGKQLLNDLKKRRRYWKLKEEALYRTVCTTRYGRGCESVVRQTVEWIYIYIYLAATVAYVKETAYFREVSLKFLTE